MKDDTTGEVEELAERLSRMPIDEAVKFADTLIHTLEEQGALDIAAEAVGHLSRQSAVAESIRLAVLGKLQGRLEAIQSKQATGTFSAQEFKDLKETVEMLFSLQGKRLGQCEACGAAFVDTSPAGTRRYCSETCKGRIKMRKRRAKEKEWFPA